MLMTGFGKFLKVFDGTEFRGDGLIVADTVGGVLAFLDTDGVDRHHPHHVYAQVADRVDAGCYGIQ